MKPAFDCQGSTLRHTVSTLINPSLFINSCSICANSFGVKLNSSKYWRNSSGVTNTLFDFQKFSILIYWNETYFDNFSIAGLGWYSYFFFKKFHHLLIIIILFLLHHFYLNYDFHYHFLLKNKEF